MDILIEVLARIPFWIKGLFTLSCIVSTAVIVLAIRMDALLDDGEALAE